MKSLRIIESLQQIIYIKTFFLKGNGTLIMRTDDRSEVVMCMEWDYSFYSLDNYEFP